MTATAASVLAEIEGRAEGATAGPWREGLGAHGNPSDGPDYCEVYSDPFGAKTANVAELELSMHGQADAAFIAHARTDVPWLLDQVRKRDTALRAVLALAQAWHDDYKNATRPATDYQDAYDDGAYEIESVITAALTSASAEEIR